MGKIAILYQAKPPPIKNGIQKPMKPGGYSDSGADITYETQRRRTRQIESRKNVKFNSE